jgi:hypothetical protein
VSRVDRSGERSVYEDLVYPEVVDDEELEDDGSWMALAEFRPFGRRLNE